jgi:hypothetical protein
MKSLRDTLNSAAQGRQRCETLSVRPPGIGGVSVEWRCGAAVQGSPDTLIRGCLR